MRRDNEPRGRLFDARRPLAIADQGCFYVGGSYDDRGTMTGQMFVQFQEPADQSHPYPLVLIHGGGQTGVGFLSTPDGRHGWSDYFVSRGFAVYVVDVPGRGRSQGHDDGRGAPRTARSVAARVSDTTDHVTWPQARRHTQWPGGTVPGERSFDQFYASQTASATDPGQVERHVRAAGAELLERIGPSVLVAHSLGAPLAWQIADARPDLVAGIVAVEPTGPALHDVVLGDDGHRPGPATRPWGLTRAPLSYEPPATSAEDLRFTPHEVQDRPDLAPFWLQTEPARRLPHLSSIRTAVVTAEASYHAPTDHGTSAYLTQAGVAHDVIRLEKHGIHGNGHMMMLEKNNVQIAALVESWIVAGE